MRSCQRQPPQEEQLAHDRPESWPRCFRMPHKTPARPAEQRAREPHRQACTGARRSGRDPNEYRSSCGETRAETP
eukprot:11179307-Lingulodinium_polyedra.AAC.1